MSPDDNITVGVMGAIALLFLLFLAFLGLLITARSCIDADVARACVSAGSGWDGVRCTPAGAR